MNNGEKGLINRAKNSTIECFVWENYACHSLLFKQQFLLRFNIAIYSRAFAKFLCKTSNKNESNRKVWVCFEFAQVLQTSSTLVAWLQITDRIFVFAAILPSSEVNMHLGRLNQMFGYEFCTSFAWINRWTLKKSSKNSGEFDLT